jgi:hypothetical protein
MRNHQSDEKWNALWRARAKAERGKTTERAKNRKRIDYLNRLYPEIERVQRYYNTEFRSWRFCRHKSCLRARACRGNPEQCLALSINRVPRREQLKARQKLMEMTPLHSGGVKRKVCGMMPIDFFLRRRNPAVLEKEDAERRRRREIMNKPYDDGLG